MAAPSHASEFPQYDAQALLNSQPVIVTVIDPSTHQIQFQNQTGIKKFGDITGQTCYGTIAGCRTPCGFCRMSEALGSDTVVSSEVPLPGNQFLLVHWAKASTVDGRTHVIETITDITEYKRTVQALQQSQKMEAIGRLAGGIAHDFNNLMMVVIGHAHRLLQQLAAHPAKREIDVISQAGLRAAALTKKLLTFSRRQVFEPKELDINASIRDMEDLLQRMIGEHVQMVVVLHPDAGHAMMDPVQLEQILMNLAVNARDAMPDGGLLNVETDCVEIDETFVRQHPGARTGSFVKIMVQDAGCGMDKETLSHIFEPFFTTKGPDKGTGLGLATVYGILKQSQGYIDVISQPGQGTRFTVYLPRVGQPVSTVPVIPTAMTPVTAKETVLLVEDDDSIRTLMATVLQDQGYHVLVAGDGIQALQQLQLHKGPCHLVVTDVIMPRMKSSVLVEGVKVMQPTARILYMSGYAGETLETSGIHEDTPFLQKPFLPSTLIEKVQEILKAEQ
ncbi:MAG: response regulator [Nitrospira sp.]|jgi:signal transduction histidine kinase|nr:response regulator [Nitrospira sp.]